MKEPLVATYTRAEVLEMIARARDVIMLCQESFRFGFVTRENLDDVRAQNEADIAKLSAALESTYDPMASP